MPSLKANLFTAASQNAGLQALLLGKGSPQVFAWWDVQIPQNTTLFPCIAVQLISNPRMYVTSGRMATSWVRVQFKIYTQAPTGTGWDSQQADQVAQALLDFMDGFGLAANPNGGPVLPLGPPYANFCVGDRDFGLVETEPMTYLRILDYQIFNNESND